MAERQWCRYINGFCQSAPIRSKIAPEQEKIHSSHQKKSELSTPSRKFFIAIWNFAICPRFLNSSPLRSKYTVWRFLKKKCPLLLRSRFGRKNVQISNWPFSELRGSCKSRFSELPALISRLSQILENLMWISQFWSLTNPKLQINRSSSLFGVMRPDFFSVKFRIYIFLFFLKIWCGFLYFGLFRIVKTVVEII